MLLFTSLFAQTVATLVCFLSDMQNEGNGGLSRLAVIRVLRADFDIALSGRMAGVMVHRKGLDGPVRCKTERSICSYRRVGTGCTGKRQAYG